MQLCSWCIESGECVFLFNIIKEPCSPGFSASGETGNLRKIQGSPGSDAVPKPSETLGNPRKPSETPRKPLAKTAGNPLNTKPSSRQQIAQEGLSGLGFFTSEILK